MPMDSASHHHLQVQEVGSQTLESMVAITKAEKKPRPAEQSLKCPRCESSNTKFCYYNNYSLSQPRYFCKSCRRYWTKGGTLRNVPVGGGCRKNSKRSSSARRNPPPPMPVPMPTPRLDYDPALMGAFLDNIPRGFHNLYGTFGVEMLNQEMGLFEEEYLPTKHEIGWQNFQDLNGTWNGSSTWHGLLNTPLM